MLLVPKRGATGGVCIVQLYSASGPVCTCSCGMYNTCMVLSKYKVYINFNYTLIC